MSNEAPQNPQRPNRVVVLQNFNILPPRHNEDGTTTLGILDLGTGELMQMVIDSDRAKEYGKLLTAPRDAP